jgi:hypothetical protein
MLNQESSLDAFELSGSAGQYTVVWPQLQIQAELSRFKVNSDLELKAEVTFSSQKPDAPGHLRRRRVNLSNPNPGYIKSLREKEDSLPWADIVEQMAVAITDVYRSGSPEIEMLGQIPAAPAGHWLIKPLVQVGHPTIIYGTGAAGKSWFGQYLSVLAHEGLNASGLEISEPSPVLYLDWETDQYEIGSRLAMIRKGLGLPHSSETGVIYKSMTQGLADDIAEVSNIVHRRQIRLVVIDSLGMAGSGAGEPESAEVAIKIFTAIRGLQDTNNEHITTLGIDHTNKQDMLFGSVFKQRMARMIFHVKQSQRSGDTGFEFALFHEKANNAPYLSPMGWSLEFDNSGGSAKFKRKDVKNTRLEGEMSVRDRIHNYLEESGRPETIADIAEMLEKGQGHIAKELSQNRDMFQAVNKGLYTLVKSPMEERAAQSVDIPDPDPVNEEAEEIHW